MPHLGAQERQHEDLVMHADFLGEKVHTHTDRHHPAFVGEDGHSPLVRETSWQGRRARKTVGGKTWIFLLRFGPGWVPCSRARPADVPHGGWHHCTAWPARRRRCTVPAPRAMCDSQASTANLRKGRAQHEGRFPPHSAPLVLTVDLTRFQDHTNGIESHACGRKAVPTFGIQGSHVYVQKALRLHTHEAERTSASRAKQAVRSVHDCGRDWAPVGGDGPARSRLCPADA